ncbi:MAG: PilZ domain-containing protein [Nannocystis sp.]|nr:PilZ domain-containing protein [Nannocystis sp.]MBA3548305.1 PilZ domain-containing protein [Nannocystis sp.]
MPALQGRAKDERRRGERHAINPEFAALEPGSLTFVSSLSETGVFINSRVRLPVGAAIDMRFTVLLDEPIVIHGPGRVIHHQDEPRGMGVAFGHLSAEMQLRVIDAINWYRARGLSGEQAFRTRELTPDELRQIDEENEEDPAEESVTSLSTSDVVSESGSYPELSRGGLVPVDDDDERAPAASARGKPPTQPPLPPVSKPPAPLKDDEYEDF